MKAVAALGSLALLFSMLVDPAGAQEAVAPAAEQEATADTGTASTVADPQSGETGTTEATTPSGDGTGPVAAPGAATPEPELASGGDEASVVPSPLVVRLSLLAIPEDNGTEGDPGPRIPSPGAAWRFRLTRLLSLEPSLDLFMTYYGYSDELQRAVPLALENRWTTVIGAELSLPLRFSVPLGGSFELSGMAGPAFDFRVPLIADGLYGSEQEESAIVAGEVAQYFWSSGRWFRPVMGLGSAWTDSSGRRFGFDLRAWMPLYRLWTAEDAFFGEGFVLSLGLSYSPPRRNGK